MLAIQTLRITIVKTQTLYRNYGTWFSLENVGIHVYFTIDYYENYWKVYGSTSILKALELWSSL